jgi:hypothetical protein
MSDLFALGSSVDDRIASGAIIREHYRRTLSANIISVAILRDAPTSSHS